MAYTNPRYYFGQRFAPQPRRTNYFIPNVNRNRPNNQIYFPRNRNIQRFPNYRPNIRIQNRKPRKNFNKRQPINKPLNFYNGGFMNNKFTTKGNNTYKLTLKVPNICFHDHFFTITIHPLFLNQLLLNHAISYTQYRIINLTLHTAPLVSVTDNTALTIGFTTHCTPVTALTTDVFNAICDLQGTRGMCHTPIHYKVPNVETLFHPIVPVVPSDIPYTLFIASPAQDTDLTLKVNIYLSLDIQFQTQYSGQDVDSVLAIDGPVVQSAVGGLTSDRISPTRFGFCTGSTIANVDLGELLRVPDFPGVIAVAAQLTHNGQVLNYAITAKDQGVIQMISKVIN